MTLAGQRTVENILTVDDVGLKKFMLSRYLPKFHPWAPSGSNTGFNQWNQIKADTATRSMHTSELPHICWWVSLIHQYHMLCFQSKSVSLPPPLSLHHQIHKLAPASQTKTICYTFLYIIIAMATAAHEDATACSSSKLCYILDFFKNIFFGFVAETRPASGRNTVIIEKESGCFAPGSCLVSGQGNC